SMRKRTIALGAVCALMGMCAIGYLAEDDETRARYASERAARDSARAAERAERARRDSLERTARAAREQPLQALIEIRDGQLRMTNLEEGVWQSCRISINTGVVRGGWTTDVARIAPGATVAGGLMTFVKSDGERFNPFTHAVQSVSLACNTPAGRR